MSTTVLSKKNLPRLTSFDDLKIPGTPDLLTPEIFEQFFSEDVSSFTDELSAIEEEQNHCTHYSQELFDRLSEAERKMTLACQKVQRKLSGDKESVRQAMATFREEISPWYNQSFLMRRATVKPRGYPGDYLTLQGIYDNVPKSLGIGSYLDRLFLNDTLAKAVRNRKDFIRDKLREFIVMNGRGSKVMNIASGTCQEWYELLPTVADNALSLTCIDFDRMALDYARTRLAGLRKKVEIDYVKENALKLAVRKDNANRYGFYNIIYSFGLYDYLPDRSLKKLLKSQFDLLKENGKMILTFKDKQRYEGTKHAWFCDWHFVKRSEQDVLKLLGEAGFDQKKVFVSWEDSGIIVFFEVAKN